MGKQTGKALKGHWNIFTVFGNFDTINASVYILHDNIKEKVMNTQNISKDNEKQLGEQNVLGVKNYIKRKWNRLGLCYRLNTFALGMSMSMIFSGGILKDNSKLALLFLCVMVGAIISTGKFLKEIYVLDVAQNYLASKYVDFGTVGKTKSAALVFGKTLALAGNVMGAYIGAFLAPIPSDMQRFRNISECGLNMVAGVVTTAWIAFLLIAIRQAMAKRYAKKHFDKVCDMAEAIEEEAFGDVERAKEIRKARHVPGAHSMQIGYVTVALCLVGNFTIIQPLLPAIGSKQETIAENSSSMGNEGKEETDPVEIGEVQESAEAIENTADEVPEELNADPNGYGFSIGQDCLNVYLEYVSSGMAAYDYDIQETEALGGDFGHQLGYFSIAGMADEEPFLLLSSVSGNGCGDEIYFVTYTPEDFSGEGIDQTHMQGSWGIESCDLWSFSQWPVIDTMYVCTTGKLEGQKFIRRQEVEYANIEGHDVYVTSLNYRNGNMMNSDTSMNFEERLAAGDIAEIKWFAVNEIEQAREYYQQYVREEGYDGPVENANRDDYYNDSTPLKYFEYVSDGVFEVLEDEDGDTLYRFSCLDTEAVNKLYDQKIDNALELWAGSDSQDVKYYFIENADGSWTYVRRHWTIDEHGEIVTISYETNEKEIFFWCDFRGTPASSIEEVIQILKREAQR